MSEREYALKTVHRAFHVLRVVQNAARPVSLSEVAEAAEISTSNAFRFLKTLEASGHVSRDSNKCYFAGPGWGGEIGITRGLSLVDMVARNKSDGLTAAELAQRAGLDEPQVERALGKLHAAGYLEPVGDRWCIATAMMRFLRPILNDHFLDRFIRPVLVEFSAKTSETVSWYVRQGWEQIVVEVHPSPHTLRYVLEIGARYPLYLGAAGKAQLAALEENDAEQFLAGLEPKPLTSFEFEKQHLLEELRQIRQRGFAVSQNERVEGASSVACAVRGPQGEPRGVVSVMMPSFRISSDQIAEIGNALRGRVNGLYGNDVSMGRHTDE
jgi:DNA-binding IclR family transcriptional regulator